MGRHSVREAGIQRHGGYLRWPSWPLETGKPVPTFAGQACRYDELAEETRSSNSGGKQLPLGRPSVKDRIVPTALQRVVEPSFENEFLTMNY